MATTAWAERLPALRAGADNVVPSCATPASLMRFVMARNPDVEPRLRDVATHYAELGRQLDLRWDTAFFHMLVMTNTLRFAGGRATVPASTNNFAAIQNEDGDGPDTFTNVREGVLAHLHHVRLYAGAPVAKPQAARTRKVQGFILPWAKKHKGSVTYSDLLGKWNPDDPGIAADLGKLVKAFEHEHCRAPDRIAQLALTSADELKAQRQTKPAADASRAAPQPPRDQLAALNVPAVKAPPATAAPAPSRSEAAPAVSPPPAPTTGADANCKVWSASFGGSKSVLIRVTDGTITHFTALQVNAGRETEETKAYIAAYARGGKTVGEFPDADQAINKAFELCPKI